MREIMMKKLYSVNLVIYLFITFLSIYFPGPIFAAVVESGAQVTVNVNAEGNLEDLSETTAQKQGNAGEGDTEDLFMLSLVEEMVEVEEMIKLQKRKLELLESVRHKYMSNTMRGESTVISSAAFKRDLAESFQRIKEAGPTASYQPQVAGSSPSFNTAAVQSSPGMSEKQAGGGAPGVAANFDQYMVAKAKMNVSAPVAHQMVLPLKMRGPVPGQKSQPKTASGGRVKPQVNLVSAIDVEGVLHVFSNTGERMISYNLGHEGAGVSSWGFDGTDNEPMLITAGNDGSIHIHQILLWRNDRVIAGPRQSTKKTPAGKAKKSKQKEPNEVATEKEDSTGSSNSTVPEDNATHSVGNGSVKMPELYTHDRLGVTLSLKAVAATPTTDAPVFTSSGQVLNATVNAVVKSIMFVASRSSELGKVILVADNEGHIRQYLKNGTLAKVLETGEPIQTMIKAGQYTAFASGPDVHFLSTSRFKQMEGYSCSGTMSGVTSLIADYSNSGVLFAGLESGDVLAFATRRKEDTTCRLMQKLPARVASSARVAAVRGYLLATAGNTLTVYNTSDVNELGIRWVFDHKLPDCEGGSLSFSLPYPLISKTAEVITAMTSECQPNEVVIHEAILPYHHHEIDIRWMRLPLLGLGLLCVFGYQWWKRRNPSGGDRFGHDPYGAMSGARNRMRDDLAGSGGFDMDRDNLADDRGYGGRDYGSRSSRRY